MQFRIAFLPSATRLPLLAHVRSGYRQQLQSHSQPRGCRIEEKAETAHMRAAGGGKDFSKQRAQPHQICRAVSEAPRPTSSSVNLRQRYEAGVLNQLHPLQSCSHTKNKIYTCLFGHAAVDERLAIALRLAFDCQRQLCRHPTMRVSVSSQQA